ncbi:hypothetical protein CDV36_013742 [Fusarium kuroshium]|uniref:Uncharacterized protein n=1 Tax=Fusarium kuroshium TaxID=2010991 RepID=A0A3M2RMW1_9HYPO|nr:hypothetical protein CDV36_013742 [Fusarium kuroshium]
MDQPKYIPRSLLPLLSTTLNVGLALGGYVTTTAFNDPNYSGPAIAAWFKDFFKPGFISVTTIGALTFGGGIWSFWSHRSRKDHQRSRAVSWWSLAGLGFTVLHFTFGNQVLSIMDSILSNPDQAQPHMARWISLHITRTLVADVPAWFCYIAALLYEI